MLRELAIRLLINAAAIGIGLAIASTGFRRRLPRRPFFWFFIFAFAVSHAACTVLFRYYPTLSTGWYCYATIVCISLVACLPVCLWKLFAIKRQKDDHDA
jgi:hypothetical protein